ncbi:Inorganic phosphate transporter pho84 [Ceratobasidium sp. 423]|nr:Inorganic phosphate transporter pho84 [Ceratobasidium sp. 423]
MSAAFQTNHRLPDSFANYAPRLPERDNDQVQLSYDQRRRTALKDIDDAIFSIFHVKACLVAGIGFFTAAYDIFAIGIAETMIGLVYGTKVNREGQLKSSEEVALKVATQGGIFIGQLLFGCLADAVGRKKMYGIELIVVIVGTLAQACAGGGQAMNLVVMVGVWRFVMGIGIGADYPLSAVITSEFSPKRVRGRMMTAVFAMQGFGAVPGCIALYCRLTIPETPRFTMDIERNVEQAAKDVSTFLATGRYDVDADAVINRGRAPKASWADFKRHFGQWKNFKLLFGMAYAWFALDIPFYTLGLNTPSMLKSLNFKSKDCSDYNLANSYDILFGISSGNLILAAGGLIPGYWATFLLVDSWGRKPIQIMGFIVLTVLFLIIGGAWDQLHRNINGYGGNILVLLYCLANFFQNFGPNTTTFIIPGEAFPTRYRATAHGIAAASGKLGAIVSQIVFSRLKASRKNCNGPLEDPAGTGSLCCNDPDKFVKSIMFAFAAFTLTGAAATLLIEETKGRTLEDISNEDQGNFIYGPGPLELGSKIDMDDANESIQLERMPASTA